MAFHGISLYKFYKIFYIKFGVKLGATPYTSYIYVVNLLTVFLCDLMLPTWLQYAVITFEL
jgi:hypothetical protein